MQPHVIWGSVENTTANGKDSSSTSHDRGSVGGDGSSSGSSHHALRRGRGLPVDVRALLEGVTFHEESNSSGGSCWSQAAPAPEHEAGSSSPAKTMRSIGNSRPQVPLADASAATPREIEETSESDDNADAGGGQSFIDDVVKNLGEEERDALIAIMLQNQIELSPGLSEFWSAGSTQHSKGKCRPCHYAHTKPGCKNGKDCKFCHLPHTKKSGPKPAMSKRLHCKQFVTMLEEASNKNPEQFMEALRSAALRSTYLQGMLERRLQQQAELPQARLTSSDVSASMDHLPSLPSDASRKNIVSL